MEVDSEGRSCGHLYVGDRAINVDQVRAGYGWHHTEHKPVREFAEAEREARRASPRPVAGTGNPLNLGNTVASTEKPIGPIVSSASAINVQAKGLQSAARHLASVFHFCGPSRFDLLEFIVRSPALVRLVDDAEQSLEVDRLDEMVVEAGLARATAVLFLAVTADRDNESVSCVRETPRCRLTS